MFWSLKAQLQVVSRSCRQQPKLAAMLVLVLFVCAIGMGIYGYGLLGWRAAQREAKDGQTENARRHLKFCLRIWPQNPSVHLLAARVERITGNLTEAEAHLNQCIRIQGGSSEAVQLEFLLMRAQGGEVDEVEAPLYECVRRNHPDSIVILETVSRAYMHELRFGPAHSWLSDWIRFAPEMARPYAWRGWVLERLAVPKGAMEDYENALKRDPRLSSVRLRVAEMLISDKKPLDAMPHLERLLRENPDDPMVKARLGECRFLQGDWQAARQLLESARRSLPDDNSLLLHLAKLDQADKPEVSEQILRHLLAVDPADPEALFTLAHVLKALGKDDESKKTYERWEKVKVEQDRVNKLLRAEAEHPSNDAAKLTEIGTTLLGIGQEQQGRYWLEQALLRDSSFQAAHQALLQLFERKGDREKAEFHRRQLQPPAAKSASRS
jgi:tetratricopeptide (TPR) repeat protein